MSVSNCFFSKLNDYLAFEPTIASLNNELSWKQYPIAIPKEDKKVLLGSRFLLNVLYNPKLPSEWSGIPLEGRGGFVIAVDKNYLLCLSQYHKYILQATKDDESYISSHNKMQRCIQIVELVAMAVFLSTAITHVFQRKQGMKTGAIAIAVFALAYLSARFHKLNFKSQSSVHRLACLKRIQKFEEARVKMLFKIIRRRIRQVNEEKGQVLLPRDLFRTQLIQLVKGLVRINSPNPTPASNQ